MDAYIKREHVLQALTYVGTAEPTDIIPLILATARKSIMYLPTFEVEQLAEVVRLQKALDAYEETSGLKQAKAEVAREIFEEIDALFVRFYDDPSYSSGELGYDIAELKKKYTQN